jgi:hypothetical protein
MATKKGSHRPSSKGSKKTPVPSVKVQHKPSKKKSSGDYVPTVDIGTDYKPSKKKY